MLDLANRRRAQALAAVVGLGAFGLIMCTQPKQDEDAMPAIGSCSSGDPSCPDAGSEDVGQLGAGLLAVGATGCTAAAECGSGVCLPDVDGTLRCCEAECRLDSGRVCSTAGECVCSTRHREVGGLCLLENGQPCREPNACASDYCADGVCCDTACDGICEGCDASPAVGTCSLYDQDSACLEQTNFECVARNRCRLPTTEPALACRSDVDCDSDHCEPAMSGQAICCATECSGVCKRCAATGVCGFPPSDLECPLVTSCPPPEPTGCLSYQLPAARACSSSGQCAECERVPTRAGIPCGVGAQCDGNGECSVTGMGLVAAGSHHTCAVRQNGSVRCWGRNTSGQLGAAFEHSFVGDDEAPADLGDVLEINFDRTVVQITAGLAHTCVLFGKDGQVEGGQVRCWGRLVDDADFGTVAGLLGTNEVGFSNGFVDPLTTGDVRLLEPAVQISAANGGAHTCAVLKSGLVSCWGSNNHGQCGIGEASSNVGGVSNETLPVVDLDPNNPNMRALQVSAGGAHTCALLSEGGRVTCWGEGVVGQLGYGENSERREPLGSVAIGEPAFQIAAGFTHSCALLERGRVRCWGSNSNGVLGYGHAVAIGDDETPEQALTIPRSAGSSSFLGGDAQIGGGGVVQIASVADASAVCARYASGAVRCWGRNDRGQLGYGHTQNDGDLFPPDALDIRPIEGGGFEGGDVPLGGFAVALADGGRCALVRPERGASSAPLALYCWGIHLDGQLGLPQSFADSESSLNRTPLEMGPVSWE